MPAAEKLPQSTTSTKARRPNDYLYSLRVLRRQSEGIDCHGLPQVHAAIALARFELRQSLSTDGTFTPIAPLA